MRHHQSRLECGFKTQFVGADTSFGTSEACIAWGPDFMSFFSGNCDEQGEPGKISSELFVGTHWNSFEVWEGRK